MYIYIYIHTYMTYAYAYVYIYIYIERERYIHTCTYTSGLTYVRFYGDVFRLEPVADRLLIIV